MGAKEDAVAAAKQLEVDGREFYYEAASKTMSADVKKMFTSLAEDETRHLEWLDRLAPGVESSREVNEALYGRLKGVFADASSAAAVEDTESDLKAIEVAIGMEDKSVAAYSEWERGAASEDLRELGRVLVGQERFHRQVLENAKEYLQRPGDWFMSQERWNFEGG
jgi:rubrerythrin